MKYIQVWFESIQQCRYRESVMYISYIIQEENHEITYYFQSPLVYVEQPFDF